MFFINLAKASEGGPESGKIKRVKLASTSLATTGLVMVVTKITKMAAHLGCTYSLMGSILSTL